MTSVWMLVISARESCRCLVMEKLVVLCTWALFSRMIPFKSVHNGAVLLVTSVLVLNHQHVIAQPGFISLDCGGNQSYVDNLVSYMLWSGLGFKLGFSFCYIKGYGIYFHIIYHCCSESGFISLDCGGNQSYVDNTTTIQWQSDDTFISVGTKVTLNVDTSRQLTTVRTFSDQKSCYTIPLNSSQRYLARATFLYGNYDEKDNFPTFDLYINTTHWATIQITDVQTEKSEEIIFLSTGTVVHVCLVQGTTGMPFISALEIRQVIDNWYYTGYEQSTYLKTISRINYGTSSQDVIRYPDDTIDRIWKSYLTKPNSLSMEAEGTEPRNTTQNINLTHTQAPLKVLQTAVVGTKGNLTYRFNLGTTDFPADCYTMGYYAEIENLNSSDTRAFTFYTVENPLYNEQVFNIAKDYGTFTGVDKGFTDVHLGVYENFTYRETSYSTLGPILNAMEILKKVPKQSQTSSQNSKCQTCYLIIMLILYLRLSACLCMEVDSLVTLKNQFGLNGSGDPCAPIAWDWVKCSNGSEWTVTGIFLSNRKLSGMIPSSISQLTNLVEISLDGNNLTGTIPDLSSLSTLEKLNLQNNSLSGSIPASLAEINSLEKLYLQNNQLSGKIPQGLLNKQGLDFRWDNNPALCSTCHNTRKWFIPALVGGIIGGLVLCSAGGFGMYYIFYKARHKGQDNPKSTTINTSFASQISNIPQDQTPDQAQIFQLSDLKVATKDFSMKIGSGGFGFVYYGNLKDGTGVAVKVLSEESQQGAKEFYNEIALLSRIHHRNLVKFIGCCQSREASILVYEYMEKGSLGDHLYGINDKEPLDWSKRLRILLDAAKGLDYLHTGCNPAIIHRDVKSSNILIDGEWTGKVADFGLSKHMVDGASIVSTTVRGTLGYFDPEYILEQRLTQKSDVYSFGIVLLETLSGHNPHFTELFEPDSSIVPWARELIQKGNIGRVLDPKLGEAYTLDAVWKVAELAMYCVEPNGSNRPSMAEVVRDLQEASEIEAKRTISQKEDNIATLKSSTPSYHLEYTPTLSQLASLDINYE